MLELCFHYVVATRFILAAGPRSVASLSSTCMFACDVLNGPREKQSLVCSALLAPHRQERLRLLTVGGALQWSDCFSNAHAFIAVSQLTHHLTL